MTPSEWALLKHLCYAMDMISPRVPAAQRFDETGGGGSRARGEYEALYDERGGECGGA